LIFLAICNIVWRDPTTHSFVISSSHVESTDFGSILQFVRSFDTVLSTDRALPLLSIFNILGNDQPSFLLFASMNLSNSKT
jgi:hypothetical protein